MCGQRIVDVLTGGQDQTATENERKKWLEVCEQVDDHDLLIDSGCFRHVCSPWFAPQFPVMRTCQPTLLCDTMDRKLSPITWQ